MARGHGPTERTGPTHGVNRTVGYISTGMACVVVFKNLNRASNPKGGGGRGVGMLERGYTWILNGCPLPVPKSHTEGPSI